MCGIAGIYDPHHSLGMSGDVIRRMTGAVRHRGPDEDGFFEDASVALGMRRLSIIDLATGRSVVDGSAVGGQGSGIEGGTGGRVTGRFTVPERKTGN